MLSDTLKRDLENYGIGEKLRALRLKKKWAWWNSAATPGLSAALLSKVERGKLFPTLADAFPDCPGVQRGAGIFLFR